MDLNNMLTKQEKALLSELDTPVKIQHFINSIPYSNDHFYRCPLQVLREKKAHCFDGALFAAMALLRLGYPPLILELIPNARDDDHLLAIYKQHNHWGAVAQSNFTGLRYREPVYRSLRELVMSYFEDFFNSAGEKTLRGYRGPINLKIFNILNWEITDDGLETLADEMDNYRIHAIISPDMETRLSLADERCLQAGLMGANQAGLFKVNNGQNHY